MLLLLWLLLLLLLREGSPQEKPGYLLEVQKKVIVQEGLCTLVPCAFQYPRQGWNFSTPAYGYWYRNKGNTLVATNEPKREVKDTEPHFQLIGDPEDNNCSLSISGAQKRDRGQYYFRLERGDLMYSYKEFMLTVTVSDLTLTPDIHIREPLQSGHLGYLKCSMPGACKPHISWSWGAPRGPGLNFNTAEIQLTPRPEDHGTHLTCRMTFSRDSGTNLSIAKTIQLNVSYAPEDLRVTVFQANQTVLEILKNDTFLPVLEGQSLRLVCVTHSNPPARLSWTWESQTLSPILSADPGVLDLPLLQWEHGGKFTCSAQNPLGVQCISLSISVYYPPQMSAPSCSWDAEGLHCSCSSRAWPAPSLRWQLGNSLLEGNSSNASITVISNTMGLWANSSLRLHRGVSTNFVLSCEALNDHGAQSATVLLLPGMPTCPGASILAAVGASAVVAMLSLSACLVFLRVKACRQPASSSPITGKDAPLATEPVCMRPLTVSGSDSKAIYQSPVIAMSSPGEETELQYASLSFEGLRPREPQFCEETDTTEYAEIKIHQ